MGDSQANWKVGKSRQVTVRWYYGTTNHDYTVEFRETVAITTALLIKPLGDKAKAVRLEAVGLIGNLANHGRQKPNYIAA